MFAMAGWWRRLRRRPSRAQLIAEAQLWKNRQAETEKSRHQAYARAEYSRSRLLAVEALLRDSESRLRELVRDVLDGAYNEPGRVEGCIKVRFHFEQEAADWGATIARRYGEAPDAYEAYPCKVCPRSPVTTARFWHAGHPEKSAGLTAKVARERADRARRAEAGRDGRLLSQRVDPLVLAQLRKIGKPDS